MTYEGRFQGASGQALPNLTYDFAHDYFTQKGGAERVAIELIDFLQPQTVYTSVYNHASLFRPDLVRALRTSFLNRLSVFRDDPRRSLMFMPFGWSFMRPANADVVVCSSSGWSHGLRHRQANIKVVYCHNPPRWVYQASDYLLDRPLAERLALKALHPFLKAWDRKAAMSVDLYIANSSSVAERIQKAYGIIPRIIFPPVLIDVRASREAVKDVKGPFFLMVGRARGYKGAKALIEAFRDLPEHRLVIAGARIEVDFPPNVQCVGVVPEAELRWLYANARGLISVSREDFGLTPIEANAFGTPALLLKAGGFIDSTDEGVNALFIPNDSVEAIRSAVRNFPDWWDRSRVSAHAHKFSRDAFRQQIAQAINDAVSARKPGP